MITSKLSFFSACVVSLFAICFLTPALSKVFDPKTTTLDNGLQIVVVENHRVPVVTHMLWYRAGAADEPVGKSGIAHFLEHLLFKGHNHPKLGSLAPGEFSKIVRRLGGEDNAFTSQDYTAYYQSVAREHLEEMMRYEAGRMRGVQIPEADFEAEKLVIQEERRQRTDNDPKVQMYEHMREALFPNHPYSIPIIGWMHEIQALTLSDAMAFYDRYYAPNNAVLIVSGAVKAEDVYAMAERTYGLIERRDTPERKRTTSPPFISRASVMMRHETIREPNFTRMYRTPSYRQDKRLSLALQVLDEIMGGGSTSRLYKALVVDQKIASGVSFSYRSSAWDDATLFISATPRDAADLDKIKAAIDAELNLLIEDGVSDTELADAKRRLKAEAIFARDSLSGPAFIIGYNLMTGSSLDDIENWPQQIEGVTADDILEAAKLYLDPDEISDYPPVEGRSLPLDSDEKNNTTEGKK